MINLIKRFFNELEDKLFWKPFFLHFILWFFIMLTNMFLIISLTDEPMLTSFFYTKRGLIIQCIISIICSLFFSFLNFDLKKSITIYNKIKLIENKAKNVKTHQELYIIKYECFDLIGETTHNGQLIELKKIILLIDTRLRYEFKLDSNN